MAKVFRSGGGVLVGGMLLAFVPAAFGASMAVSLVQGTLSYEGRPIDPGNHEALVAIVWTVAGCLAVSAILCAYGWVARVVVADDRVAFYNLLGLNTFEAEWSDVTAYRRVRGRGLLARPRWRIEVGNLHAYVPQFAAEPRLQVEILDHLARAVIQPGNPAPTPAMPEALAVSGRVQCGGDAFAAVLSLCWYVVAALIFAVLVVRGTAIPHASPLDRLLPWVALALYAMVPAGAFRDAWRRWLRAAIHADASGVRYCDGVRTSLASWDQLRWLEWRAAAGGESDPAAHQLMLLFGDFGVRLDGTSPLCSQVGRLAHAMAPNSALIFDRD